MHNSLFRKEAVDHKTSGFASTTRIVSPLSFQVLSLFVLLVATTVVAFVILGQYSPKDTLRGYVTTTLGGVEVYAPSDGVILAVHVAEGDTVTAHQDLLKLSTSRSVGHSAETSADVVAALRAEQGEFQLQALLEGDAYAVQEQGIKDEIASLHTRLALQQEQRKELTNGLALSERTLERLTALEGTDFVSSKEQDEVRAAIVEHNLRLRELDLVAVTTRSDIRRNEQRLVETPVLREAREAEMRVKHHELSRRIIENSGRTTQRVLAPMDGVVSGLLVRDGQTVSSSSPLLNIVPEIGNYYVEVLVPTRAIAFLRSGAPVRIRYDAYPYQKFGTHKGVVESVSRSTVLPHDKRFGVNIAEPVYIARVRLRRQSVVAHGVEQPLHSGMTLTADILRDQRRLIEWIFDPLIGATKRL